MAEPRVLFSKAAEKDVLKIEAYIASRDDEQRAQQIVNRIPRTLRRLAFMPGAGRVRPDLEGSPHTFLVQSWRGFYRPTPELDGIVVIRVLDTRRDINALMRKKLRSRKK